MPHSSKADLRSQLLAARRARTDSELHAARDAIGRHVLAKQAQAGWRCVAGYEPLATEPGSTSLLAELSARGVRVLVPLTLADRDLDWTAWTPSRSATPLAVATGDLGVEAIGAADAVLVPALAADPMGTRLGRGAGSYDRALRRVRPVVPVVAVLFEDELVNRVPVDSWDVAVDAAVTPAGWHELGPRNAPGAGRR